MGGLTGIKGRVRSSVINMFKVNMGLKAGERALVLTDYPDASHWAGYGVEELEDFTSRALLARAVYEVARESFKDATLRFIAYPLTGRNGAGPPPEVAEALIGHDVIVAITSFSITHTNARRRATEAGARVASMPGFTMDMFDEEGPISVDYREVRDNSLRIARWLKGASEVRVTSPSGTDVRFTVRGREWGVDDGIYDKPGSWGNLPAGEVYVAPVEGTAEGVVVVERGWHPGLNEDMAIHVSKGLVTGIDGGGAVGDRFREVLGIKPRAEGPEYLARRNIAEFGIGTNPKVRRPDNVLEAEKIEGTIHIAIGDSSHLGGVVEADIHEDFVIPRPTVIVDGEVFMESGAICVGLKHL